MSGSARSGFINYAAPAVAAEDAAKAAPAAPAAPDAFGCWLGYAITTTAVDK